MARARRGPQGNSYRTFMKINNKLTTILVAFFSIFVSLFLFFTPKVSAAAINVVSWTNNCGSPVPPSSLSCKGNQAWTDLVLRNNTATTYNVQIRKEKYSCDFGTGSACGQRPLVSIYSVTIPANSSYDLGVISQNTPQTICGSAQVDYFFTDPVTGVRSPVYWGFAWTERDCVTPTPTSTRTPTPRPTNTSTPRPPTSTPTRTPTMTPPPTNTPTRTPTQTPPPTSTPTPTRTPTQTPPPTYTPTPTRTPTQPPPPTSTKTPTRTPTKPPPTATPTKPPPTSTLTPTKPPPTATRTPTKPPATPTKTPTKAVPSATRTPTKLPPTATRTPTKPPQVTPTRTPTPPQVACSVYAIDEDSGNGSLLIKISGGKASPVGKRDSQNMNIEAIDSIGDTLYGVSNPAGGRPDGRLFILDKSTGTRRFVGTIDPRQYADIVGLAYNKFDGKLYGWVIGKGLVRVATIADSSGRVKAELVRSSSVSLQGIAWGNDGSTLYGTNGGSLFKMVGGGNMTKTVISFPNGNVDGLDASGDGLIRSAHKIGTGKLSHFRQDPNTGNKTVEVVNFSSPIKGNIDSYDWTCD